VSILTILSDTDSDRIAKYGIKFMDIDSDILGIPNTNYDVRMSVFAAEFSRIMKGFVSLICAYRGVDRCPIRER
jgi:proliferating cell nuclear antigen